MAYLPIHSLLYCVLTLADFRTLFWSGPIKCSSIPPFFQMIFHERSIPLPVNTIRRSVMTMLTLPQVCADVITQGQYWKWMRLTPQSTWLVRITVVYFCRFRASALITSRNLHCYLRLFKLRFTNTHMNLHIWIHMCTQHQTHTLRS